MNHSFTSCNTQHHPPCTPPSPSHIATFPHRRLLLAAALILLVAGSSCFAQPARLYIHASGSHVVDGVTTSSLLGEWTATSGTLMRGHGPGAGYPDGGVTASVSPGRVSVSAGSYASYGGPPPQPYSLSFYNGGADASFSDYLTITGRHGIVVPYIVRIRITWRTTGGYLYEDPDPGWGGDGTYWAWNTSNYFVSGVKGRRQYGQPYQDGSPSVNLIFTEDVLAAATGYVLDATVSAGASSGPYVDLGAGGGYARASGHCSMEVLSIEILDPTTGKLLPVNVTAASGHVYPVAQPQVPGLPPTALHLTSHSINRDSGAVMLSFASEAGASYRVMGSTDLGRTDPWQVMTTLPGQSGASIATFTDPNATTQPSRFYKIERVVD